ncbi:hypothetical protein TREES_T100015924 [Tupaia chinensis]|uniref:Uncharacterized protein n=1 Tax=Tupaia chinensis TaxID=246437 RepID=L9KWD5_TUPCH|nr:hypothetical protein TREES_T100015924 [Tupaia chinensis]
MSTAANAEAFSGVRPGLAAAAAVAGKPFPIRLCFHRQKHTASSRQSCHCSCPSQTGVPGQGKATGTVLPLGGAQPCCYGEGVATAAQAPTGPVGDQRRTPSREESASAEESPAQVLSPRKDSHSQAARSKSLAPGPQENSGEALGEQGGGLLWGQVTKRPLTFVHPNRRSSWPSCSPAQARAASILRKARPSEGMARSSSKSEDEDVVPAMQGWSPVIRASVVTVPSARPRTVPRARSSEESGQVSKRMKQGAPATQRTKVANKLRTPTLPVGQQATATLSGHSKAKAPRSSDDSEDSNDSSSRSQEGAGEPRKPSRPTVWNIHIRREILVEEISAESSERSRWVKLLCPRRHQGLDVRNAESPPPRDISPMAKGEAPTRQATDTHLTGLTRRAVQELAEGDRGWPGFFQVAHWKILGPPLLSSPLPRSLRAVLEEEPVFISMRALAVRAGAAGAMGCIGSCAAVEATNAVLLGASDIPVVGFSLKLLLNIFTSPQLLPSPGPRVHHGCGEAQVQSSCLQAAAFQTPLPSLPPLQPIPPYTDPGILWLQHSSVN